MFWIVTANPYCDRKEKNTRVVWDPCGKLGARTIAENRDHLHLQSTEYQYARIAQAEVRTVFVHYTSCCVIHWPGDHRAEILLSYEISEN